jgi:uncharacterized protein (DUF2249 family)
MTTEIDLRDQPAEQHSEYLFDARSAADTGDEFDVVAARDVDPHLVRFQLENERGLHWEYSDPDAEPRELAVTVGDPLDDPTQGTIDVRDLKPQRRHEALLDIFDDLDTDEGFVLVNDHDPKPLYYELRSMHGDVIDWEYMKEGSGEWRVAITRTGDSETGDEDVVTRYDVREIPKPERHPTIHHRYGMIPDGGTMEIIAPHEPRPLHQEFRQQYGDSFAWEVIESEPGRCRVHITKGGAGTGAATEDDAEAGSDSAASDAELTVTKEFDVRMLPPAQRHERIYDAYDELAMGEAFIFVNDHDPKPLYHQFEAESGPEFHWEYRQRDHGEFKVLIGKVETDGGTAEREPTESPF